MALSPGTRVGPFEVTGQIGAGGMGEVYRATDSNLKRSVAIKVLPARLAGDADRLARFQREAEVLATLNHPNIAGIYGLERTPDFTALVMELVEGQDLSEVIAGGAQAPPHHSVGAPSLQARGIPLADVLPIAKQIAEALEAAHEHGIIHRDLKPANIKIRTDGTVKVLDFGLAKAMTRTLASGPEPHALADSPTMTSPAMTGMGIILGTAAYMSPEQAKGREVDRRADIWAFGVVLHEMLTGRRLFDAEDASETLAAVLTRDVSLAPLPPAVPARLRALIRDCLIRDPKQRLRDIGDARLVLDKLIAGTPDDAAAPAPASAVTIGSSRTRERVLWAAIVVLAVLLGSVTWQRFGGTAPAPVVSRFELALPAGTSMLGWPELSPDGRHIAAVVIGEDRIGRLWIRPMDALSFQVLAGSEGASYPFWSPGSRSIGFFANDTLKQIAIAGGPPQPVCPATRARGGTWSPAGVMVFSSQVDGVERLQQVAAEGGTPSVLTPIAHEGRALQRFPHFLPDGRHFLFFWSVRQTETTGVYVGAIGETDATRLVGGFTEGRYSDGRLFFVRDVTLMAQPFDATARALSPADAIAISPVLAGANEGAWGFSVSDDGVLVAVTPTASSKNQLRWLDRSGRAVSDLGTPSPRRGPRISPDGLHVVTFLEPTGNMPTGGALWLTDIPSQQPRRLTMSDGGYGAAVWLSNQAVAFVKGSASGVSDIFQQPTTGEVSQQALLADRVHKFPQDVSPDGQRLVYLAEATQSVADLWVLSLADKTPSLYIQNGREARISPNGEWVAYANIAPGQSGIYIQSFPTPGTGVAVSSDVGASPIWHRSGNELFYKAAGKLMAVTISTANGKVAVGQPVALFDLPPAPLRAFTSEYDVARNGQFLFNIPVENQAPTAIVTLNWKAGLKK